MTLRLVKKKIKAVYIGVPYTPRLPDEYQEVEYIESSGTQWIDVGYKTNRNISTKLALAQNTSYTSEYAIFGDAWSESAMFLMTYQGYFRRHFSFSGKNVVTATGNKTEIETSNAGIKINGTMYSYSAGSSFSSNNIHLFNSGDNANSSKWGRLKLYYFQLYDDGILKRDLVPCYRKSDDVIGLYDLVGGQFYINNGTGTFAKGQNVGRPYVQIRPSDPATIILNAINNNDTSALSEISANAEMMKVLISNTNLTTAFIAKNDLLQQFVNTMWNTVSSSNLFTLVGNGSGDDYWDTQQTWAATANSITFFSGGYYSSTSTSGLMYHRGGALAKRGNKGGYRPGSVNTNNVEGVSFVGATFGQSGDGYVASATYRVT